MNRWLVALWSMLLTAITCVGVLAQLWIQQRAENSRQRRGDLLSAQVKPFNQAIEDLIAGYADMLSEELATRNVAQINACLELKSLPLVDELVVLSPTGQLHFPPEFSSLSLAERSLLSEASQLIDEHTESIQLAEPSPNPPSSNALGQSIQQREILSNNYSVPQFRSRSSGTKAPTNTISPPIEPPKFKGALNSNSGSPSPTNAPISLGKAEADWITWYHSRGMIMGFLWTQPDGFRCMLLLPKARWVSDIVALLPESKPNAAPEKTTLDDTWARLVDIEGRVVYQWSDLPSESWLTADLSNADAELPVVNPLEGWRLRVFASPKLREQIDGDSIVAPIWLAVAGISAALVVAGIFVSLNLNRQMRLASQRVSFVNQVSHELKTPLTNIRMYAEMLSNSAEKNDQRWERDLQKIAVIRTESERLSRLISGVLHFAKNGQDSTQLAFSACVLDEIVGEITRSFEPKLAENNIKLQLELNSPTLRMFDQDAVEQILVNLVSNAEKYGAEGGRILIRTEEDQSTVQIHVLDFGPGVPSRIARKIFTPFFRGNDRLESPAGTGIGLTIARDLATKHGGNINLVACETGAHFTCVLATRPVGTA